eukprot:m.346282 g.346282  ORF g.346282 m.346282 type:complete len:196 (-) comp28674_c0_seq1:60-647(-)
MTGMEFATLFTNIRSKKGSSTLECLLGDGNGLDVILANRGLNNEYSYEGDVVDNLEHGVGIKTYKKTMDIYLGHFANGDIFGGDCIWESPTLRLFFPFENGEFCLPKRFNPNNIRHASLYEWAQKRAAMAKQLASTPWSPSINHYYKFKRKREYIIAVLLCGERLRQHGSILLSFGNFISPLPTELWELILAYVL